MPFEHHPSFTPAPSPELPLWRYIGVPKFVALLQTRALHFTNLELLARSDPFEGSLPASSFRHREWGRLSDVPPQLRAALESHAQAISVTPDEMFGIYIGNAENAILRSYAYRRSYFLNCWHLNHVESAAMWDIYSRRDEGIAIVSSEARIVRALAHTPDKIYGSCVAYGDYEDPRFIIDDRNGFNPVLRKRSSFHYEQEYRLVYWDDSVTHKRLVPENGFFHYHGERIPANDRPWMSVDRSIDDIESLEVRPGHTVPVDLEQLVADVYVSPLAPDWIADVVQRLLVSHGIDRAVQKSTLLSQPRR